MVRLDRHSSTSSTDVLSRGKRSIALNLKSPEIINQLLEKVVPNVDVLIDPFRPGVLEGLGLGPDVLMARNPRLILARISGFGQSGPRSRMAGMTSFPLFHPRYARLTLLILIL